MNKCGYFHHRVKFLTRFSDKITFHNGANHTKFRAGNADKDIPMLINFIPNEEDHSLIEVHLGHIIHGYILQQHRNKYQYFRLVNNKPIQRHEANSLDILKKMVLDIP